MYGFRENEVLVRDPNVVIARGEGVLLVCVIGVVDDAVSERWRGQVADEVARNGPPRFIAVDFSACDPQNSMSARYRSAAFARDVMKKIEYGVVLTGGTAGPTVVVRAVLRALGLPNLEMMVDPQAFATALASMRRGVRPDSSRLAS